MKHEAPWVHDSPRDRGIHEVFADLLPSVRFRDAVRAESEVLTYQQLHDRSNRAAHYLLSRDIRAGDRVAMFMDRSVSLIVWQLAILKTGAICVPIDVKAPAERVAFFLQDCDAKFTLCGERTTSLELPSTAQLIDVAAAERSLDGEPADLVGVHVDGAAPAYILYTSGSTGVPKGVLVPHRGVVRLVRGQSYFPAGPDQCTLLLASPGFDGTNYEIWSALLNGGACAVFADHFVDYSRLEHVIETFGVTCVWFSTGLFNQIVDRRIEVLSSLKHVLVGGEALSAVHMKRAMSQLPKVRFANGYGPTECATFAVAWTLEDPALWGSETVPLGWPLSQTECVIVDESMRPVAEGDVGELLLGGDGLALGYLNRPELSDERFVRNPFSDDPNARLYHTGDRCFQLPSGMIGYVGRNDDQVKLNGFRVELGEVESAIRKGAGVVNAAVVVHEFPSGARALVAGVVLDGAVTDVRGVQSWLATQLPDIMRPARLLPVEQLPLTLNGKVDRRVLGKQLGDALSAEAESDGRSTVRESLLSARELQLLGLFRDTLRVPNCSVDTDFFHAGGDSLLAAELEGDIERAMRRRIPGGTLHRFATVRALSAFFERSVTPATPLAAVSDSAPVLWLPDMMGYGRMPTAMANALQGKHPIFDRFHFTLDANEAEHASVEMIVQKLLPQALEVAPNGPVILAGYSFGGYLAYEMARVLSERGRSVSQVILWDAQPETDSTRRTPIGMGLFLSKKLITPSTWTNRRWIGDRARYLRTLIGERVRRVDVSRPASGERRLPATTQLLGEQLWLRYRPLPYSGPVTLLACTRSGESIRTSAASPAERWSAALAPRDLVIVEIDCHHSDVFTPQWIDRFVCATLWAIGCAPESAKHVPARRSRELAGV